ncbi:MAG: diacylglyceryl transferase, partial [Flavobacteriaceae bacterium CG_4_10_14_0_8_um_filter_34_31]
LLFLAYQIILLIIGWLYGEIDFFWAFEKKMLRRFGFKNLDDAS